MAAPVSPYNGSENLYHILITEIDYKNDRSGATQKISIEGTYTSLPAAKAAARTALFEKGYEKDWFPTFEVQEGGEKEESWKHGDGTIVYAVAPEGEVFIVRLETAPNVNGFWVGDGGKFAGELWHVVQTTILYDKDASGALRETSIEGSWQSYDEAKEVALKVLLSDEVKKEDFAEYDEKPSAAPVDWEFGEDVVVHAVGKTGENVLVSVVRG